MSTIAYVAKLPNCDFCKIDDNVETPAAYDAKTNRGPWASMCEEHYTRHRASDRLGTGNGQKYIVGEKPKRDEEQVRRDIDEAMRNGDMGAVMEAVGDGDLEDYLG